MEDGPFMPAASELQLTELAMDGVTVLLARGDLDIASASILCRRLQLRRSERVVLDLSEASFCDMAGMRAVADESRATRAGGGIFTVVAPDGCAARRLLELAGGGLVEVHDDRTRAIARVRPIREGGSAV